MEIIIKELSFGTYLSKINCHFKSGTITGVTGNSAQYLLDLLNGDIEKTRGHFLIDSNEVDAQFYRENPGYIAYVNEYYHFYSKTVIDEFLFTCSYRKYKNDMIKTKINNLLVLVGLGEEFINREIESLSTSEKVMLSIALNLVFNPKVFILGDVLKYLDKDNRKRVISILANLRDSDKIIILYSDNVEHIYDYSDIALIFVGNRSDRFGPTDKVYTSEKLLIDKRVDKPKLVKITHLARKKKVKLAFHKDLRDIIKDVYRNV